MTDHSLLPVRRSSFKYLAAWQSHSGFEEMLANMWKPGESIVSNIERFQLEASRWNKKSFGHIGRHKHVLMARIRGIERINEAFPVPYFQELEDKLKGELTKVLRQEESLWFQRSRREWIKGGDRNTKYYHRVAKVRH
ncbi:hypothetical protein V6N11_078824 [Hibiscus sabdariffa]|uniref:Uncharacterized protein n=1 Tax=Hibiscus sabdariffa TaxID=183260 RepID=A0ABR2RTU9_9ROSI